MVGLTVDLSPELAYRLSAIRWAAPRTRRMLIQDMGLDVYLPLEGSIIHHEPGIGSLWRIPYIDDEPLCAVEVVNSTAGPDGEAEHFFLRVPPHMRTAREAVAWTFGLKAEDYLVTAES